MTPEHLWTNRTNVITIHQRPSLWTSAGNMGHRWFKSFAACACLWITKVKGVLILGLQINVDEQANLQMWNSQIMSFNSTDLYNPFYGTGSHNCRGWQVRNPGGRLAGEDPGRSWGCNLGSISPARKTQLYSQRLSSNWRNPPPILPRITSFKVNWLQMLSTSTKYLHSNPKWVFG